MTTRVISINQAPPGWETNPEYVYIGRDYKHLKDQGWGNPHHVGFCPECSKPGDPVHHERGNAVGAFKKDFNAKTSIRALVTDPEAKAYAKDLEGLSGKILVCFCKPRDCHGDVYAEYLNSGKELQKMMKTEEQRIDPHSDCGGECETPQSKIVAGTGHRPNKLGGYSDRIFWNLVKLCIKGIELTKPTEIISGGALGFDQALAQAARDLGVPYQIFVPFAGQEGAWPVQAQVRYNQLLDHASNVVYVGSPGYQPWKMQTRNEAMVDACHYLMCLWDGTSGGTGNCVKYAQRVNKPMGNLWERWTNKNF